MDAGIKQEPGAGIPLDPPAPQVIRKPFPVDVDETLILEHPEKYPGRAKVEITCYGRTATWAVHEENVEMLKKFVTLGYTAIVWSRTDAVWATAVVKALGLESFVSFVGDKALFYMDDLGADSWMERVWREPGEGEE